MTRQKIKSVHIVIKNGIEQTSQSEIIFLFHVHIKYKQNLICGWAKLRKEKKLFASFTCPEPKNQNSFLNFIEGYEIGQIFYLLRYICFLVL